MPQLQAMLKDIPYAAQAVPALIVLLLAAASHIAVKQALIRAIHFAIRRTRNEWDDALARRGVFECLAYLVPVVVIFWGRNFLPLDQAVVVRSMTALFRAIFILAADRFLSALLDIYNTYPISRKRPLKGYVQIVKIFLYICGIVLVVCTLLDQSPWGLLSGIGALTAFILFVFKDTILSFIASLQIVANDLVRVGDWIEAPQYGADGDVMEIALHTVKVRNWDKTITTIPTYKLVDGSFKNWRGMTQAGGRRIKRALLIDQTSVRFCDDEMIERLSRIQILRPYIEKKQRELEEYNRENGIDPACPVNGRRMTNLGTFRQYVVEYLRRHPKIRQDMTFLVRQLAPTPDGLPLEIYVFTNDTVWANYEAIQADIFDHLLASVGEFGLRVYQRPSGMDLRQGLAAAVSEGAP